MSMLGLLHVYLPAFVWFALRHIQIEDPATCRSTISHKNRPNSVSVETRRNRVTQSAAESAAS